MYKYITYDIEALQNIKLAKSNIQEDSEDSMDYITGSAIRGAFIYKYIHKYGLTDINQGIHREKIFKGDIKFFNAYPKYEDNRSIPFPKCYFAPKEDIRRFKEKGERLKMSLGLDDDLGNGFEKIRLSDFVCLNDTGETYTQIKVNKESNLHINKQSDTEKNLLFRYESIKKGQFFGGIIKVKKEYVTEIFELLNKSEIYVGGSKGSGYGKCIIKNMQDQTDNPEYKSFENKDYFEDEINLVAMSDIIYRSKSGEYCTIIDAEYIKDRLGLDKVNYCDSCIETKNITGFNNKWNCRIPQIVGIKAGSVFKYEITGEVDKQRLREFIDEGIGERKSEGFGRFVIIDSLEKNSQFCNYEKERDYEERRIRGKKLCSNFSDNEKEQIQGLFDEIYKNRIEKSIIKRVNDIDSDIRNRDELNKSQWGKLMDLFIELSYKSPEKGIEHYNMWKRNVSKKDSLFLFNKVKVKDESIIGFLSRFVEKSSDITTHKEKNEAVEFMGFKAEIKSDFAYKMNMKILTELCRYQIRKERTTG